MNGRLGHKGRATLFLQPGAWGVKCPKECFLIDFGHPARGVSRGRQPHREKRRNFPKAWRAKIGRMKHYGPR